MGNLNCTFFTNRLKYNRNENLQVLKATLDKLLPNRNFEITPRFDLVLIENQADVYKISGTSSRLAKNYSYHHCTLLLDADMANMDLLKPRLIDFISENKGSNLNGPSSFLFAIELVHNELKVRKVYVPNAKTYWKSIPI
jgi:lipoate-protein ligase A